MTQITWRYPHMKQKVFLGALLTTLVLPMMVGCNSRPNNNNNNEVPEYTDNSETLNKTSIGEASINNITKYTAIGVSKLDKKSPNKKYSILTSLNDDDSQEIEEGENGEEEQEEPNPYADLSNTLVGLTTEGILEELSLTIQSGQQLNSSTFSITYYEELGDFVLVSVLPMDVQEYVNGVSNFWEEEYPDPNTWNEQTQQYDVVHKATYNDRVAFCIEHLNYPLRYSIRYLDESSNEYKYIDTSYLIHKRSGKLFPFSSREYCVDPQKCLHGEFINPTVYVNDESISNYPVNSLVKYSGYHEALAYSQWDDLKNEVFFTQYEGNYFELNNDCFYNNELKNSICIFMPWCMFHQEENPFEVWESGDDPRLYIIMFNQETSSLDITSISASQEQGREGSVYIRDIHPDRFGNFFCMYKERLMVYNIYTKEFKRADFYKDGAGDFEFNLWDAYERYFDRWTQQYFYKKWFEEQDSNGHTYSRQYIVFLNENMEEDYRIYRDYFDFNPAGGSPIGMIMENTEQFINNSFAINERERILYGDKRLIRVKLDQNGRYSENISPVLVLNVPGEILYCEKNYMYYLDGLTVHKISTDSNYESYRDSIHASLNDYPFVEKVWYVGNGVVGFEGMDNHLNTITGYIQPDGTISFEIEEFSADSQTSTLSPIN